MGSKGMKGILKTELKRAFKNKYLLFALLIGCAISLWHTVENVLPIVQYLEGNLKGALPHSVFNKWMGGENYTLQPALYYIIVPLLVTLPFGASFYQDRKSGYLKNIFTRTDKKQYYKAKYIAVFLSGGIAGVVPLLFNFLSTAMFLPLILPQVAAGTFSVYEGGLFADLFYTNPYAFLAIYMVMNFVFFGLLATIALVAGHTMENYFVVLLTPFLYYILFMFITNFTGNTNYNMQYFLRPSLPVRADLIGVLVEGVVLAVVTLWLFIGKGAKNETF